MASTVPNTQTGSLADHEQGSDDTSTGFTFLVGDARAMFEHSRGGNATATRSTCSPTGSTAWPT